MSKRYNAPMSSQFLSANLTSLEILDNPIDTADTCDDYSGLDSVSSGVHTFGGLSPRGPMMSTQPAANCSVGVVHGRKLSSAPMRPSLPATVLDKAMQSSTSLRTAATKSTWHSLTWSHLRSRPFSTPTTPGWSSFALGLDLFGENGIATVLPDDYLLDIWIGELAEAPLNDTCAEANGAESTTTGSHYFGGSFH